MGLVNSKVFHVGVGGSVKVPQTYKNDKKGFIIFKGAFANSISMALLFYLVADN